jgi:hypothetical protein
MTETSLVLAAPERKRILRELLARPEPWPITHLNLYREMLQAEFWDLAGSADEDTLTEHVEKRVFTGLVMKGVPEARARQLAEEEARKPAPWEKSKGRAERERRSAFRQAVTAGDGALAVTTGLVRTCIICNGPFFIKNGRQPRSDSAYCSDACRQAAYRRRRKRPPATDRGGEDGELTLSEAMRITGLSSAQLKRMKRISEISEAELIDAAESDRHGWEARILASVRKQP